MNLKDDEKKEFMIESHDATGKVDLNMYNMVFIREKSNYRIHIKNFKSVTRLRLKTPLVCCPFGIEKWLNKEIVNIEFSNLNGDNKDNMIHNFWAQIQQIDKFFISLKYDNFAKNLYNVVPKDLLDIIKDKTYVSCIRPRGNKFNPLLRTHIKKTKSKIETVFFDNDDKKNSINPYDVKGKYGQFTIELASLWINNDVYGVTWYLNGGILS